MGSVTEKIHDRFLCALARSVVQHSDVCLKPLRVDLDPPHPPRLRVYAYSLVGGLGTVRPHEYKSVLRVPGQAVGEYGSFEYTSDRIALVIGYHVALDVFVLWDASMHLQFKNGGNIQVKDTTVLHAAATGWAEQVRSLSGGRKEFVLACQSWTLGKAIHARILNTGGRLDDKWATSPNSR